MAAVVFAACVPVEQLPPQATSYCPATAPTSPTGYQQAFDGLRTVWTEWAAADGAIPVDLQDGRTLWLFGDTIIGRVRANGSIADPWSVVRNSFVVQDAAGCLTPVMGGTRGARTEVLANPAANQWYWPTGAVVEPGPGPSGTQLRVYLLHLVHDPSGPAGLDFDILDVRTIVLSLPSLQPTGPAVTLPMPTKYPAPSYGRTVLSTGGVHYAYGMQDDPADPFDPTLHSVARVPEGQESANPSEWDVYDAQALPTPWSADPTQATPMLFESDDVDVVPTAEEGPKAPLEVVPYGVGYLAVAKKWDALSDDVSTWFSLGPEGPWTFQGEAATGQPHDLSSTFTYGGRIAFDLPGMSGQPVLMWSQNHNPFGEVILNNALYKAFFAAPAPGSIPP